MAEDVVSSFVQTLSLLLTEEAKFLCGVKGQASDLIPDLQLFQDFLKDADAIQVKKKIGQTCVAEIRERAYIADITLRAFLDEVQQKRRRRGGNFLNILKRCGCILNEVVALHKVGSYINEIKIKMDEFTPTLRDQGIRTISEGDRSTGLSSIIRSRLELRRTYSHIVEENFVGFEDDLRKVVASLLNEKKEQPTYRAVLIRGMGGQGKTTLVRKVYHSPAIRRHFERFAWACVSQQWTKKDVLQTILISLMPNKNSDEVRRMEDPELVRQLYDVQKEKKCLVVLDDVWSPRLWESISPAFPSGENVGSKILLTSRNIGVVSNMNNCSIHELKLLSDEESWQLFNSIFRKSASTGREQGPEDALDEAGARDTQYS